MNVLHNGNEHDGNNGDHDHHGKQGKHGKHGRQHHKKDIYECRIDLDDENRRHELLEQCCEQQVRGDLDPEGQTVSFPLRFFFSDVDCDLWLMAV